jgi:hypothetical protein
MKRRDLEALPLPCPVTGCVHGVRKFIESEELLACHLEYVHGLDEYWTEVGIEVGRARRFFKLAHVEIRAGRVPAPWA